MKPCAETEASSSQLSAAWSTLGWSWADSVLSPNLSFPVCKMRAWVNCSFSPLLVILSHDPVMVRKPSSFGNCQKIDILCTCEVSPRNLWWLGFGQDHVWFITRTVFPLARATSALSAEAGGGLGGGGGSSMNSDPCQSLSTSPSFEVACLFNLSLPCFPHPFMATFVQGYCHLLFLSLACLQFKYLKEDGSNLTMLMKWVTLMVGLSKAALSSSAGKS